MLTRVNFGLIISGVNGQATVASQHCAFLVRLLYEPRKEVKTMGVFRWYADKFSKFGRWIKFSRWNAYVFLLANFFGAQALVVAMGEFGENYYLYFFIVIPLYLIVVMPLATITIIELLLRREDHD